MVFIRIKIFWLSSEARDNCIKYLFLIGFGMAICGIPLAVVSTLYAQLSEFRQNNDERLEI